MPGDKITAKVYAKYVDSNDPQVEQALRNFLLFLGAGNTGGPLVDDGSPGSLGGSVFPYPDYLVRENDTNDGPKAYLNYLIFDRDFNYLNGGFKRLTTSGRETGTLLPEGSGYDELTFEEGEIKITEPGFVYIYLSNENENRVEVFFDDFTVTHTKSPVIQQDDYYPFGLTFNSNRREKSHLNRYLYNQGSTSKRFLTERVFDLGINIDLTKYRAYDPVLGRWWQNDPLADKRDLVLFSPYNYAFNNPIRYSDPEGDCPPCYVLGAAGAAIVEGVTVIAEGATILMLCAARSLQDPLSVYLNLESNLIVLDFEALRKPEGNTNFAEYEKKVLGNSKGISIDWTEFNSLASEILEVINLLVVKPLPSFYSSEIDYSNLQKYASFYIECTDSNTWSVFSENEIIIKQFDLFFRDVINRQ